MIYVTVETGFWGGGGGLWGVGGVEGGVDKDTDDWPEEEKKKKKATFFLISSIFSRRKIISRREILRASEKKSEANPWSGDAMGEVFFTPVPEARN